MHNFFFGLKEHKFFFYDLNYAQLNQRIMLPKKKSKN